MVKPLDPFLLKEHLLERGIKHSDNLRNILMDRGQFPPCVMIGMRRPAWRTSDIETWEANLPRPGLPLPVLWPLRERKRNYIPDALRQGRKPGGTMVTDPVTGKRRYMLPERPLITSE